MRFLRILFAFILYFFIITLFYLFKPSLMFHNDGSLKDVGFTDQNKSILSLYIMIPVIILIIYIILEKFGNVRK